MLLRFTNGAILGLIIILTLTGLWGLALTLHGWLFEVHRMAGWALLALVPWKAVISWRSLRRGVGRHFDRNLVLALSLLLTALASVVWVLAVMWAWRLGPELIWVAGYADTAVSWHWMLALALLLPLAVHIWRRWPRPRRSDFTSRRAALKLLGLGAAGVAAWWAAEKTAGARADPAAPRRFTGSVEQGSFSGNAFPVTNSPGEGRITIDAADWALAVGGAVARPLRLTYDEVLALATAEQVATLDCTIGWYSTQIWRGVPLWHLLEEAGLAERSWVRLRGVSGYFGDFSLAEARDMLLATHVGGETLNHWHGFPLRAVAPTRRGWFWVKWLTEVEVLRL
jgi:DMSO/TMAO reductase YedYZ molybdopterin-dependent catalytic subunit